MRVKLNAQPFQILLMLLERPGELLTRDEISRVLWPEGTFVDYEHGVNSAVNRIREALGERPAVRASLKPSPAAAIVSSLPSSASPTTSTRPHRPTTSPNPESRTDLTRTRKPIHSVGILSSPTPMNSPRPPTRTVQTLFVLLQLMYLAFYVGALSQPRRDRRSLLPASPGNLAYYHPHRHSRLLIPVRAFLS